MDEENDAPLPPDTDSTFDDALSDAAFNFDSSLKSKLTDAEYKKLRTIGAFVMRGLSIEESCVLARVSKEKLDAVMEANDDVKNFIIFKQIAYKAELLNTLSASATTGRQAKSAGYLLEKKYPKEFDVKKTDDSIRDPDMIEKAIQFVRSSSEQFPLVKRIARTAA